MSYVTSFDYEKYSIDKTIIEKWLTKLYENSCTELKRRDSAYKEIIANADEQTRKTFKNGYADTYEKVVRDNIENELPFLINGVDQYLYKLISKGYINSSNFLIILDTLVDSVDKVLPIAETDTSIEAFNSCILGIKGYTKDAFSSPDMAYIDENKAIKLRRCYYNKAVLLECINNCLNCCIVDENISQALDYYEQIKEYLEGYKANPSKFDENIYHAFDILYSSILYELNLSCEEGIDELKELTDATYKSIFKGKNNLTINYSDEVRVIMAAFIGTDPDCSKDKATSKRINSFTKKFLDGDYFGKRCEGITEEERNDLFMSLNNMGALYNYFFSHNIRANKEKAMADYNSLVESVSILKKHQKGNKKHG